MNSLKAGKSFENCAKEGFTAIKPQAAELDMVAVHGDMDGQ